MTDTDPDADARRELRTHRAFATFLLLLMAALTLGCYALPPGWGTDLLQAAAKAGFVGGIADWFAVTALFAIRSAFRSRTPPSFRTRRSVWAWPSAASSPIT